MNVRHAYMLEHKHTHRLKSPAQTPFKRCLDFHPLLCLSAHTNTRTRAPPATPLSAQRQSVRVGSEESVCRAPCPAASWKAVDFEVFRQVIAAGKFLLADDALVRFHSGVGAPVSGQLVGAGEPVGRRPRMWLIKSITFFQNIKHLFSNTPHSSLKFFAFYSPFFFKLFYRRVITEVWH